MRSPGYWADLYHALRKHDRNTKVLCHEADDYRCLSGMIPSEDLWFHADAFVLLRQYAQAHTVVSGRVHACIPAYGIPGTKVTALTVDLRGSTVDVFPAIQNLRADECHPDGVVEAVRKAEPSAAEDLEPWMEVYRNTIVSAVQPFREGAI